MSDHQRTKNQDKKGRAPWHDYALPGTYLLTIVVEGRRPLLGQLSYMAAQGHGQSAQIELTPLGRQIAGAEIHKIHHHYPNVQVWAYVIMPDHMYLIVRVNAPFPPRKHLGNVVYGFKTGCTRAWWHLSGWCPGGKTPGAVAATAPEGPPHAATAPAGPLQVATAPEGSPEGLPCLPLLFEKGYNDGILMNDGQLDRWKHYLSDNPRRLAIKRLHPDYFTVLHELDICGVKCQITGNRFLLDIPDKVAVIVHRADSALTYQEHCRQWLACGERGGVLVSASISPREKEVMRKAMDSGYRIILLRENGFSDFYKPSGEAFDACANGQLLQISPWQYHLDCRTITRGQCLFLNDLATKIVQSPAWY